ncbi:MAG: MarR family transcriptional regulator [Candidatus Cohnella colombiensis]|uniref:MarR family transcriptional regulator n=1 Tax=Candidatus Cohnella colombiensis TaxID=3121368 RepID=A0AA95EUL0_9BACL|nr:MAG: MarR family transcriptional regulator [Cohnella sp.]
MDTELLKELVHRYERASYNVNRSIKQMLLERLPGEMTMDQYPIMRFLLQKGQCTSSELADNFNVGKSSITAMITRLSDKGLIVRKPDQKDRRVIYLMLTPEGETLCSMMDDQVNEILMRHIKPFEKDEAIAFIETFEKLSSRMMKE